MKLFPPAAIVGEQRHCWVTGLETYGIWRVEKRKTIFHQFATTLRLLQKGTEFSKRVAQLLSILVPTPSLLSDAHLMLQQIKAALMRTTAHRTTYSPYTYTHTYTFLIPATST